jgi:hypothetical protein
VDQDGVCECTASPAPECTGETCLTFTTCKPGSSCGDAGVCMTTAEGGGLCVDRATPCPGLVSCPNGTSDCPPGEICGVDTCCGDPVCVPPSAFCRDAGPMNAPTATTGPTIGSE